MECTGRVTLPATTGTMKPVQQQVCRLVIAPETLTVHCQMPEPVISSQWRRFESLTVDGYTIRLNRFGDFPIVISHLGFQFENALEHMRRYRSLQLAHDLLFKEEIQQIYRRFRIRPQGSEPPNPILTDLHITRTALIFLPDEGVPKRIPAADIVSIHREDYSIGIDLSGRGSLLLERLGNQLDPLLRDTKLMISRLENQTREWLRSFWPDPPPTELESAVSLFLDGRAAPYSRIRSMAPSLWPRLEEMIRSGPLAGEFRFLLSHSAPENLCIGFKQGLWGDKESRYIWMLILFPESRRLVLEAGLVSEQLTKDSDEPGKASYFFNAPDLDAERFARALRAVNFRREPIYLSPEHLSTPRYESYLHSVDRIPELKELRSLFIARVPHRKPEQWQRDCLSCIVPDENAIKN